MINRVIDSKIVEACCDQDCCSSSVSDGSRKIGPCPACGQEGVIVVKSAVQNLVFKECLAELGSSNYFLCTQPDCQVVYYQPDIGNVIYRDALRVKVWLKDEGEDVPLCYCHNVTRAKIKAAWQNGVKTYADVIKMTGAQGRCDCQYENPSGSCCSKAIKQYIDELAQSF